MKSLVYGCAAAALLLGLADAAQAQIVVTESPVHAVPADGFADAAPVAADDDELTLVQPAKPAAPAVSAPAVPAQSAPVLAQSAPEAPAPKAQAAQAEPGRVQSETLDAQMAQLKAAAPPAAAAPAPEARIQLASAEPVQVQALLHPKAPAAPALTPDETAFFSILGSRVTDAASAYESYVRRAGAIDPAFTSGASVQRAVNAAAAYHPKQLEEGIVAYAALVALRNPGFVDGVRAIGDPSFAARLAQTPELVLRVQGAQEAAADVAGVLRAQGASLTAAGKAVTKAAYDIQSQAWSKSPAQDPKGLLDAAKLSATQTRAATTPSKAKLLASLVAAPQAPAAGGAGAPDVIRGLALAALAISGHTGDGKEADYEALLHDASGVDCLKMAKLNLNQCLAVAGPNYEEVYCAGRHAIADTGKCLTDAATGVDVPASVPLAAPRPRLQQAEGYGPEQAEAYGQAVTRAPEAEEEDDLPVGPQRYAEPAPRAAPPAAPRDYARNDYAPAQPQYQPQPQSQYQHQQSYQPQPQAYPQQQPYAAQGYPQPYAGQGYYQPYGYAARGYYGR